MKSLKKERDQNPMLQACNLPLSWHLIDGTVFDSSVQRGQPATFPLNRVIKVGLKVYS